MDLKIVRSIVLRNKLLTVIFLPARGARRALISAANSRRGAVACRNLRALLAEPPLFRLDDFLGSFEVPIRSDIFRRLVVSGAYEPDLARRTRDHVDANRDAIDIGANIGFFSVLLAKIINERKVLAVEPTNGAGAILQRNLERNGVSGKVLVYKGAVGSEDGEGVLSVVEGREEYSSLGALSHDAIRSAKSQSCVVQTSRLDTLVQSYKLTPGFLKVDVEGVEHLVWEGAQEVLSVHKPVILSELSDPLLRRNGSSAATVVRMLRRHGYRVVDAVEPDIPVGRKQFCEILAIPA